MTVIENISLRDSTTKYFLLYSVLQTAHLSDSYVIESRDDIVSGCKHITVIVLNARNDSGNEDTS